MSHGEPPKPRSTVGAPGHEREVTPEEAEMLREGTIYDGEDPEAADGIAGDVGVQSAFDRLTEDLQPWEEDDPGND